MFSMTSDRQNSSVRIRFDKEGSRRSQEPLKIGQFRSAIETDEGSLSIGIRIAFIFQQTFESALYANTHQTAGCDPQLDWA